MKVLIILAVAGACVALPHSFIADTPEVQAERQRFFQLYNAAAAAAAAAPDDNAISRQATHSSLPVVSTQSKWTGSFAATHPAGVNGPLTPVGDTPEVAAAKRTFENAFQQQLRFTAPKQTNNFRAPFNSIHENTQKWNGPLASTIPAGLPGSVSQVRNTPEVEAAIAEFTRTYNAAVVSTQPRQNNAVHHQKFASHSPAVSHHQNFASHSHAVSHPQTFSSHSPAVSRPQTFLSHSPDVAQPKWLGPFADTIPAGLPGSSPQAQETPEVAAAKAAFNRAFQQQLAAVHG